MKKKDVFKNVLRKNISGTSIIELTCGLVIMVPLILLAIDAVFIYEGFCQNKAVCLEATRAAASGPPNAIMPGAPQQRADAVLQRYSINGPFQFGSACNVVENVVLPLPGPPLGGPAEGQVTVETTVKVNIPFIVWVMEKNRSIQFTSSETLPYTYTMPSTQ